jgi:hypothetical protein
MATTGREDDRFADEAKRILKSEMERRGYSFKRLAAALEADGDGSGESVQTLINKVNRGRFTFAFFVRAARAMGVSTLSIAAVDLDVRSPGKMRKEAD